MDINRKKILHQILVETLEKLEQAADITWNARTFEFFEDVREYDLQRHGMLHAARNTIQNVLSWNFDEIKAHEEQAAPTLEVP
jgi:hypothetical protein